MKLFKRRTEKGEALFKTEEEPEKDAAEKTPDAGESTSPPVLDKATEPKAPEASAEEGKPETARRDRADDEGFFDLDADEVADYRPAGVIVAARKPLNLLPALKILVLIAVVGGLITGLVFIWPSSMARVPSLVGQPLTDAMETARAKGFDPAVRAWKFSETHSDGVILAQDPKAMDVLEKGSGIKLTVSKGPRPEQGASPGSTAAAPATATQQAPFEGKCICIDPGNQQNPEEQEWSDPGQTARTPSEKLERGTITGNPEYLVNMDIAEKLKNLLEKDGVKVVMTRESNDVQLSNVARDDIAYNAGAALMVSIHCPTSDDPMQMGTRTLYPTRTKYTDPIYENSKASALFIQSEVLKSCGTEDLGTIAVPNKPLFNWSKVPVVQSEPAYLSNPRDDSLMAQDDFRWKIAWGLRNGILKCIANPQSL